MFYVVRRLHLADGDVKALQVVQVAEGVVCALFPFAAELQSMLWAEEAYISHNPSARVLGDVLDGVAGNSTAEAPLFLYSCDCDGEPSASSPVAKLV